MPRGDVRSGIATRDILVRLPCGPHAIPPRLAAPVALNISNVERVDVSYHSEYINPSSYGKV